jgi:PhzF family phenazine biosynthesis protein
MQAFVVDAFTSRPFSGNPAGVVLLEEPAEPSWMQDVAAEFKHSETCFVLSRDDGEYDLRWFTPAVEVDLCGHATLAAAHVLAASGARPPFRFHTRSGVLGTDVAVDGTVTMDFPAQPTTPIGEPVGLSDALGVTPVSVHGNGIDLLVSVTDADTVRRMEPDIDRLRDVECRGVIVTAPAGRDVDADFVSRWFGPRVGVDEDPVTGSAHCALAPYWSAIVGRPALVGLQLSPRGGRVGVELRGDRVLLRGCAVTVLAGTLTGTADRSR